MSNLLDSRKTYFENIGNDVTKCNKIQDVLKSSGLDYKVEKKELYLEDKKHVDNWYATVRDDNNSVLGVVGKDYCVLDNIEGFEFINEIINGNDAMFESAGSWDKGRRAFIVAKTKSLYICGDEFTPYILFTNSHDGSGSIKVMFTPIRVLCSNTIILAEEKAQMKISIRHSKNAKDRLKIAQEVLTANSNYIEKLKKNAEIMNSVDLPKEEFIRLIGIMTGVEKDDLTNIKRQRAEQTLNEIKERYNAQDLQRFNETVWRAVQCISDWECHRQVLRETNNPEIQLYRVMSGMKFLNEFIALVSKKKKIKLIK